MVLNPNGSFTYTPTANFNGTDTFTYKVSDDTGGFHVHGLPGFLTNSGHTDTAKVTITVTPVNDAPVARDDSYSTAEDHPLIVADPSVLANDTDVDNTTRTAVLATGPAHGTLALNASGSFTYTPTANFNGTDSFTYRASDGATDSSPATVNITVTPVNDAPVANDDAATTVEDTPVTINVLTNDTDIDSNVLTPQLVSQPAKGTLSATSTGWTYTPNTDSSGTDGFTYKVSDGTTTSNTATVSITINAVNDAPVAVNDGPFTTDEDTTLTLTAAQLVANDTDPDTGDTLKVHTVGGAVNGSVILNANGTVTFTPTANYTGPAAFTYQVSDAANAVSTNTATVSITVTPVDPANSAPTHGTFTIDDVNTTTGAVSGTVSATDPDGSTVTYTMSTPPSAVLGTASVDPITGAFTFTPSLEALLVAWSNDSGTPPTATFTVSASDGQAAIPIAVAVPIGVPTDSLVAMVQRYGSTPSAVAVGPDGAIYVTNSGANTLSIITPTNATTTVTVGRTPQAVTIGTDGRVWVVNTGDGTVTVTNQSGSILHTVAVGQAPSAITMGSDGTAYVTNSADNTVTVINPTSYGTDRTITVGATPIGIATGPDGRIYTANYGDGSITIIDPTNNHTTDTLILDGVTPYGITVRPDGTIAVTDPLHNTVTLLTPSAPAGFAARAAALTTSVNGDGLVVSSGESRYSSSTLTVSSAPTAITSGLTTPSTSPTLAVTPSPPSTHKPLAPTPFKLEPTPTTSPKEVTAPSTSPTAGRTPSPSSTPRALPPQQFPLESTRRRSPSVTIGNCWS